MERLEKVHGLSNFFGSDSNRAFWDYIMRHMDLVGGFDPLSKYWSDLVSGLNHHK